MLRAVGAPLVWGYTSFDLAGLVLVGEDRAERLADELDRVRACATVGQVRALLPGLAEGGSPLGPDEAPGSGDDDPFDWTICPGMVAGTWPPLPTAEVEKALPRFLFWELFDAAKPDRMIYGAHGPGWHIDEYYVDEMLAALRYRDRPVRCDEDLVGRLCWRGPGPDR